MSILIPGMEMPKDGKQTFIVSSNGVVFSGSGFFEAVELPPHGRLIDADAFLARNAYFADREFVNPMYDDTLKDLVDRAKTIIPADQEKEE